MEGRAFSSKIDPFKMRDPGGRVEIYADKVIRRLRNDIGAYQFLNSSACSKLVRQSKLIEFVQRNGVLESRLVPFVTFPHEWSDYQFRAAANLTLDIGEEIIGSDFELKDASAWNIIFEGTQPIFCDHLSFRKIVSPRWWALGQFARHFILPLYVSRETGIRAWESFSIFRDGIPPDRARRIIGFRRYLTRCWPLLLQGGSEKVDLIFDENYSEKRLHRNLYRMCRFVLSGSWQERSVSPWEQYQENRFHYTAEALDMKMECVSRWLEKIAPDWLVDLGCNNGEYSVLGSKLGSKVIAIDSDHNVIERIAMNTQIKNVFPVISDLSDLKGGRGWGGKEFPSLAQRLSGKIDVILMLGLIHHLAISEAIPFPEIAQFASDLTKKWLIVEFIQQNDPMVELLCNRRGRSAQEFSLEAQDQAFKQHFKLIESVTLKSSHRLIHLFERRG